MSETDLFPGFAARRIRTTGAEMFAVLHTVICVVLLFAAPLVAADSVAKERREGTLGLLALTPLRPFEVVIGKALAHVIRLVSLWLDSAMQLISQERIFKILPSLALPSLRI